ncbi:MAG: cytochrome c oxidase subunit 3 [Candidatus Eremiobacteraeota bacterium]|nr:cytochrome c oxidase subunit 3 [Candidatus Eremiobacteraeota bacterium]
MALARTSSRSVTASGEQSLAIRAHPLVFGVVIFLASELMFFAGLFAAYFDLRSQAGVWPPAGVHLDLLMPSVGTGLLFLSSMVMFLTTRALERRRYKAAHAWLAVATICGIAFIAIALYGYAHTTFSISSNAYGSMFYALTGFHLLHVSAGIMLLAMFFLGMRAPAFLANHRSAAEAISYYWHFVFVVWLGIYVTIYVIR